MPPTCGVCVDKYRKDVTVISSTFYTEGCSNFKSNSQMKLKNESDQERLVCSLRSAQEYRWKGGKDSCYEILDNNGKVLFGRIWSEDEAVVLMTLAELIQGKTNLAEFIAV